MYAYVTNAESVTITAGQAVYLYQATGNRASVKLAYNTGDATSAKTLGLVTADITAGATGFVTTQGVLGKLNTGSYTEGDTLYLGATAGSLTVTKPKAPNHLVYIGVVERANNGNGQIYVRVQNGYELDEIHDVQINSPANGQTILYDASTSLWKNANLTAGTGISISNGAASATITNSAPDQTVAITGAGGAVVTGTYPNFTITTPSGTVTSVTGTAPVNSTGGATPAISLAASYGDTQNPYASKTANFVLAAPNGAAGVPTFRAVVAADIPTLNQNTTGTAANVTGIVAAVNGGTGQSSYAVGDIVYASTTTALSKLADVATGNALISGGVGVAPSYGKIGLTTHVSGTLAVGNGGTGVTTLTGLAYGNATSAFTAATAAQVVSVIGTTAVTNATNAVNADTVDTYHASQAESANTLATRNASGYLFASYFNGSGTFATTGATSGMARFTGTNGTDTYGRSYTAAAAATALSGQTMNIAGSSTSCTGNAATASNVAGLVANTYTTYTNIASTTAKGGWNGMLLGSATTAPAIMADVTGAGLYRESNAFWSYYYHYGNNSLGIASATTSASYALYVTGAIFATASIVAFSDKRKKENIVTIDNALDKVCQMRGVYYNKIDDEKKTRQVGVIAQEMQEVLPEAVSYAEDLDEYGVSYGNIVGILIESIKELKAEVKELKAEVDSLKGK
jgi:hypothetical protein